MPSGKRKRVSSPTGGGQVPEPLAQPKKSRLNSGLASDAADKVEVVYELVGTSKSISRPLSDSSLYTLLPEVASALSIPPLGVSFSHLRNGAVESPVYDDFDWHTIRERALATDSKREVIRVYSAAFGQTPPPASLPGSPLSAPTSGISSPAPTPRSALRAPGATGTPRSEKRVVLALPIDQPASPSPNAPQPATKASKKRNRKKNRLSQGSDESGQSQSPDSTPPPTAESSDAPSSSAFPSATAARQAIINKVVGQFKPNRPSPLGQPESESDSVDENHATSPQPLTAKQRKELKKQARLEKDEEHRKEQKRLLKKEKKKRRKSGSAEESSGIHPGGATPTSSEIQPASSTTPASASGEAVIAIANGDSEPSTSDPVTATPGKSNGKEAASQVAEGAAISTPESAKKRAKHSTSHPPETPTQRYMRLAKESLAGEHPKKGVASEVAPASSAATGLRKTKASKVPATDGDAQPVLQDVNGTDKETSKTSNVPNGVLKERPSSQPTTTTGDADATGANEAGEASSSPNTAVAVVPDSSLCFICGESTAHQEKECPTVATGVGALKERLKVRKAEVSATAKKAGALVRPAQQSDLQVQALTSWIDRLTTVRNKVVNGSPKKTTLVTLNPVGTIADKAKATANGTDKSPEATTKTLPNNDDSSAAHAEEETEPAPAKIPSPTEAPMKPTAIEEPSDSAGAPSNSDSDESDVEPAPAVRMAIPGIATPETPFYPQALHLKAAARPRRPGSMSGLSVSDAVIETVDSDSDSESTSRDSDEDSSIETSASDSESDLSSSADLDPEALMRQIMTKPLTQKQRKQARRSAASMHNVAGEEEDVSDISSDEGTPTRVKGRRGSDSSIGDFAEPMMVDEVEVETDSDSEGERERAALVNAVEDATTSTGSVPRSLSRIGMSSPAPQDLPGDIVMREAIDEDAALDLGSVESVTEENDFEATQVVPPPATKRLVRRAVPPSSQPVSRILRTREPSASQPVQNGKAASNGPQSNSQPLPTRRTRSSSRDPPPASQRTTRSQKLSESPEDAIPEEEDEEPPAAQQVPSEPTSPQVASSSQAVSLEVSPSKVPTPRKTQSSPLNRPFSLTQEQLVATQTEEDLFLTQGTQQETQFYNHDPPALLDETQPPGDMADSEPESEQEDDESNSPPSPAFPSFSQQPPSPVLFPTLGSLPKELLRAGGSMATSLGNMFSRQKRVELDLEDSESESGSDSSDEQVPETRKARYAGGRRRKERRRTNGDLSGTGW